MPPKNAIEHRLDLVEDQWFAFTADPNARIGRWRLDGDGIKLVETFMETQTLEESAVPDFFLRLSVPLTDPAQYGYRLREAFLSEIEAAAEDMADVGVEPWQPPPLDPRQDDIGEILASMHAFRVQYASLIKRVIVVLMPGDVGSPEAWRWWVDRLTRHGAGEDLRFMVFDDAAAPLLDEVAARHSGRIMTLAPDLDMPGAIDSLVRQVGGSGPADLYRRYFVGMSTAAQRGNLPVSLTLGASALALAKEQGWAQQRAVIHMALGTILMGAGRLKEAFAAFRESGGAAAESRDAGDPGSDVVVLQARLAEAAALLQADALSDAAHAYEDVIAISGTHGPADPLLLLESRRMAAHCYERLGRPDAALHHLSGALQGAGDIDESQRLGTTLPYVVQSAWRVTADPVYAHHRPAVEARVAELLGPNWPALVQEKLPA